MVSNSTWAGMKAMNLRYSVSCTPCDRMVDIDLDRMPPDGNTIGLTFRCSHCGRPGQSIIYHNSAARSYPGSKARQK